MNAQGAFHIKKTFEIQYNIACMTWLLGGGLILMQMVKY